MTQINSSRGYYQGTTYNKLSRELVRYEKSPADISPVELMEWAIDLGEWTLKENMDNCDLSWYGPYGSPPMIGSEHCAFRDRNIALTHMRAHYAIWYSQKRLIEKAFYSLAAQINKHGCNCEDSEELGNDPFSG